MSKSPTNEGFKNMNPGVRSALRECSFQQAVVQVRRSKKGSSGWAQIPEMMTKYQRNICSLVVLENAVSSQEQQCRPVVSAPQEAEDSLFLHEFKATLVTHRDQRMAMAKPCGSA